SLHYFTVDRVFRQFEHPRRCEGARHKPTFNFPAVCRGADAANLRDVDRWKKGAEPVDLALSQQPAQEGVLAADVPLWVNRVNDEGEAIHGRQGRLGCLWASRYQLSATRSPFLGYSRWCKW